MGSRRGIVIITLTLIMGIFFGFSLSTFVNRLHIEEASGQAVEPPWKDDSTLISEVLGIIRNEYLHNVDSGDLLRGAVNGMLEVLGDDYAFYMEEADWNKWLQGAARGTYAGIGVVIRQIDDYSAVVAFFDGSPAKAAGLDLGDRIISVDGHNMVGESVDVVSEYTTGPAGTDVSLELERPGEGRFTVTIRRQEIVLPTVAHRVIDGHIGYIELVTFNQHSVEQFITALNDLEAQGIDGLILDLRDNGGGVLAAVLSITDILTPEGVPLVHIVNRQGSQETITSRSSGITYPLVVLVNGKSASASEILAGAVQDTGSGTIVGEQTFGKGLVQRPFPLERGGGIYLTVEAYLTPDGHYLQDKGITPDVVVELAEPPLVTAADAEAGIKPGVSGDAVRTLQQALSLLGYKLQIDGVYGRETAEAVKELQFAAGLEATGSVDVETAIRINRQVLTSPYSDNQLEAAVRVINDQLGRK